MSNPSLIVYKACALLMFHVMMGFSTLAFTEQIAVLLFLEMPD